MFAGLKVLRTKMKVFFAGNPTVDFFSLDVEGAEYSILRTIPFHKVDIRVIMVEMDHSKGGEIIELMESNGYRIHKKMLHDTIFVKK